MAAAEPKTRLTGWALEARDAEMLRAADAGMTGREIARKFKVSRQHVEKRLTAARKAARPPDAHYEADADPEWVKWVEPIFPIEPFTPGSRCAHKGDIKRGSYLYCPVCHQSGVDHRAALRRDPRTDPKPEPKPPAPPAPPPRAKTRRERRAAERAG